MREPGRLLAVDVQELFSQFLGGMSRESTRQKGRNQHRLRTCLHSVQDITRNDALLKYPAYMRLRAAVFACLIFISACSKKNPEEVALSPRDSLKAMQVRGDFHVELFAAEPEVMSPVEMVFDENGKVYVAEMMDYPEDPPAG